MQKVGVEVVKPVAALAAWTMVMWVWMYATRLPAMTAAKIDPDDLTKPKKGGAKKTLDDLLPAHIQWIAHNYNHLHEAPTVFYAVALALAVIGQGDGLNATLAWAYVAFRVLHSLVQATVNKVTVRFLLFALSSFCLMGLTANLCRALFF